jgi:hypothetical protein
MDRSIQFDSGQEERNEDDIIPPFDFGEILTSWGTVKRLLSRNPTIEDKGLLLCNSEDKVVSCFKKLLMQKRK